MPLILSGSVDISGSMTATTILVSSPGGGGMVSSSAQITELAPLMAYTASIKSAAIVSSSQQIQNYFTFARTGSANTFYGNITVDKSSPTLQLNAPTGTSGEYRLSNGVGTTHWSMYSTTGGSNTQSNWALYSLGRTGGAGNVIDITPAGNIGIETPIPDTTLHISGSDGIKIQAGGNADTPALTIINYTNQYGWAKFGGGLQGNGRGYATISNWDGSSVSEKVRVSGDGYLRLAGAGIQFNGDTADANSLDDYEEGTWTPALSGGTSGTATSGANTYGNYTKIGRLVTLNFVITLSSVNTLTGNVYLTGIPFNLAAGAALENRYPAGSTTFGSLNTSWASIVIASDGNTTKLLFSGTKTPATSTTNVTNTDLTNSSAFAGSIQYIA